MHDTTTGRVYSRPESKSLWLEYRGQDGTKVRRSARTTNRSEAEAELKDQGRVLVRYSGTQPMCRVMVEGPTEPLTRQIAERLAAVVKETIG